MAGPHAYGSETNPRLLAVAVLAVSTYLVLVASGTMFLLVVSLKQIAGDFGWPRAVPSFAYALFFVGTGVGGIAMGYWFDRSGPGPVSLLGMTMLGTGAALAGFIESQWQLYLVYGAMMGLLGYATVYGPLSINVMRWFDRRRGLAVGLVAAGESIGGTVWPPVFRYFNETAGWRDTFFGYGVFVLATALPLSLVLWRRMPGRGPGSGGEGSRRTDASAAPPAVGRQEIRLSAFAIQAAFCLAIVGCCVSMAMPVAHLVSHASDLGHATARAAEMLATALFAATIVRLAGGALVVDRFGGLVSLLAFSGLQTVALLFYAAVDGMLALYAVSALFGIGYGGISICYPVIVREHLPPSEAGRRLGVILLFGTLAMALGGWLAGYIFDATGGYTPAFLVGAAFNATNLIIVLALIARMRTGGGAPMRPSTV